MFGEKLPVLWWVGAMGLVVGNVVIGRKDEEGGDTGGKERAIGLGDTRDCDEGAEYRDEDADLAAEAEAERMGLVSGNEGVRR